MDKVREEFEKEFGVTGKYLDNENRYVCDNIDLKWRGYKASHKSRDEEIKKLKESLKEVLENIKYFTDRVEAGTIHSRKTYAIYKNLLAKYEKISQTTWDLLPEDKEALKESE